MLTYLSFSEVFITIWKSPRWAFCLCPCLNGLTSSIRSCICEGFLLVGEHIIVLIIKSRDPVIPSHYRTNLIGHSLLGQTIWLNFRDRIECMGREKWCPFTVLGRFPKGFTTMDHILIFQDHVEEGRAQKRESIATFWIFRNPFILYHVLGSSNS